MGELQPRLAVLDPIEAQHRGDRDVLVLASYVRATLYLSTSEPKPEEVSSGGKAAERLLEVASADPERYRYFRECANHLLASFDALQPSRTVEQAKARLESLLREDANTGAVQWSLPAVLFLMERRDGPQACFRFLGQLAGITRQRSPPSGAGSTPRSSTRRPANSHRRPRTWTGRSSLPRRSETRAWCRPRRERRARLGRGPLPRRPRASSLRTGPRPPPGAYRAPRGRGRPHWPSARRRHGSPTQATGGSGVIPRARQYGGGDHVEVGAAWHCDRCGIGNRRRCLGCATVPRDRGQAGRRARACATDGTGWPAGCRERKRRRAHQLPIAGNRGPGQQSNAAGGEPAVARAASFPGQRNRSPNSARRAPCNHAPQRATTGDSGDCRGGVDPRGGFCSERRRVAGAIDRNPGSPTPILGRQVQALPRHAVVLRDPDDLDRCAR